MGRKVGRCQGRFQGSGQQLEIDGNQQPAKKNSPGNTQREKNKSQDTWGSTQNPVAAGNKSNDTLLDFQNACSA